MKRHLLNGIRLFTIIAVILTACKKESSVSLSTVSTYPPLAVSSTAVTLAIYVESDGGSHIIECGIYIGTSQDPETTGQRFQVGNDTGIYEGQLSGLVPDLQYFVKAFARNSKGESLGNAVDFRTPATITDYDNNLYETVRLGNQVWMAENLRTTSFRNGDPIPSTSPATADITAEDAPEYQWPYDGIESNAAVYGRLYTAYTLIDDRGLCPTGWHVPTDPEWTILTDLLGGENYAGGFLKESGTDHWNSPNTGATDETLFSALPGGAREELSGSFTGLGTECFLTSSESDADNGWYRHLSSGNSLAVRTSAGKKGGLSVRCLQDL